LIAIEAYDHYLRVHTDQGEELITLRFADALADLALAHGYGCIARGGSPPRPSSASAGVAEPARRASPAACAPVSRGQAQILKDAGWV
jgi:hypothetical protein